MSQRNKILKHLESGKKITPIQALEKFSCLRLAARIEELRERGHDISTKMIHKNGKSFAEYSLG